MNVIFDRKKGIYPPCRKPNETTNYVYLKSNYPLNAIGRAIITKKVNILLTFFAWPLPPLFSDFLLSKY